MFLSICKIQRRTFTYFSFYISEISSVYISILANIGYFSILEKSQIKSLLRRVEHKINICLYEPSAPGSLGARTFWRSDISVVTFAYFLPI